MRSGRGLTLRPGSYSIVRLGPLAKVPAWAAGGGLSSVTRTRSELSIVCRGERVPPRTRREDGFRCLEVEGPLPFDATGVLSSLAAPLARAPAFPSSPSRRSIPTFSSCANLTSLPRSVR